MLHFTLLDYNSKTKQNHNQQSDIFLKAYEQSSLLKAITWKSDKDFLAKYSSELLVKDEHRVFSKPNMAALQ